MVRRQSAADRQQRLDKGVCPIHGSGGAQIDGWYEELDWYKRRAYGKQYTLFACGRGDCLLVWKAYRIHPDHPMVNEMVSEWAHVLEGESDDDLQPQGEPEHHIRGHEFVPGSLPDITQPYMVVVQWSMEQNACAVMLPEWEGIIENPVAYEPTYAEAAYEGMLALDHLLAEANARGQQPPSPRPWRVLTPKR